MADGKNTEADAAARILVVDDEPDLEILILQRFRRRIKAKEIEFVFARNGVEALDLLRADARIGVMFTDINMPEMDGLTLLGHTRDLGRMVKSVVISAYGDMVNIRTAMNAGAFDFLTKPLDLADLDRTLDKTLHEAALHREAAEAQDKLTGIERELSVAGQIQQAMLPDAFPAFPDRNEFELYATMIPARAVGGDFYDFFFVDENTLGILVGDVSGKGVPAALLMALTRMLTKATAMTIRDPAACIKRVNRFVFEERASHRFVTMFYGLLDLKTGELSYCNAGHNPPIVVGADASVEVLPLIGGIVVGIDGRAEFQCGSITLGAGDAMVCFSDGVTEAMNASKKCYGDDRLLELLASERRGAEGIVTAILQDLNAHVDGAEQSDDVTVLALRLFGEGQVGEGHVGDDRVGDDQVGDDQGA